MELSLLILVRIHKSYTIYLEIYVVPIGPGFSFFLSWKSYGKSMLKKRAHPDIVLLGYWHQRADERQGNPPPR